MATKIKVTDANVKVLSLAGLTGAVGTEVEVTAEALEKALALSVSANETAAKAAKDAQEALVAEKAVPVAKRLSVDAKATPYFVEAHKSKAKTLSTTLDAAQKRGAINKPMRDALEKLLSVSHGFALSVEGVAEVVDVAATVETVLAAIPDAAVVPVSLPAGTQGSEGKPTNETPKFDAAAQADRALILAGFKTAPATNK